MRFTGLLTALGSKEDFLCFTVQDPHLSLSSEALEHGGLHAGLHAIRADGPRAGAA